MDLNATIWVLYVPIKFVSIPVHVILRIIGELLNRLWSNCNMSRLTKLVIKKHRLYLTVWAGLILKYTMKRCVQERMPYSVISFFGQ